MEASAASQDEGSFAGAVTAPLSLFFSGEKLPSLLPFGWTTELSKSYLALDGGIAYVNLIGWGKMSIFYPSGLSMSFTCEWKKEGHFQL